MAAESLAGTVGGDTGFHRVDLRFAHATRAVSAVTAVTFGRDRTFDDSASLTDRSVRVRTDLTARVSDSLDARFGADARLNDIRLDVAPDRDDRSDLLDLFPTRTDHAFGGYVGVRYHPDRRLVIEPGLRGDLYFSQGQHAASVDPRLLVSARLSRRFSVEHRFGLASQKPNFVPGVPAAQVGSLDRGLVKGFHASSARAVVALPLEFSASVAAFESRYQNVVDPLGQSREFRLDAASLDQRGEPASAWIRAALGGGHSRVGSAVSFPYTLSWATRQAGREDTFSGYDRRHVLQGALAFELWWKVRASVRGLYYSGFPGARDWGWGRGAVGHATRLLVTCASIGAWSDRSESRSAFSSRSSQKCSTRPPQKRRFATNVAGAAS